jgi:hypothetical protein
MWLFKQVLTASDGFEAIALFAEHKDKIKGVLMDILKAGFVEAIKLISI